MRIILIIGLFLSLTAVDYVFKGEKRFLTDLKHDAVMNATISLLVLLVAITVG